MPCMCLSDEGIERSCLQPVPIMDQSEQSLSFPTPALTGQQVAGKQSNSHASPSGNRLP